MSAKKIIFTSITLASLAMISSIYAEETTSTGTLDSSGTIISTTSESGSTATPTLYSDTGTIVGGDKDEHGCIGSAGYSWSGTLNQCIRPWETNNGSGIIATDIAKINENRAKIEANWAKFHEDNGFIKNYLLKPASKEQVKQLNISLKVDLKAYHEAVKALIKEGSDAIKAGTFDPVVFNSKAEEIFAVNIETLLKYIDPAKVEDFKKFMEAKKATILANKELRKENFQIRQEIKTEKKRILSEKQREAVSKKLEKRANDFLTRLIQKIDQAIAKTKNEKLKLQLEELKELTQEKLDSIGK